MSDVRRTRGQQGPRLRPERNGVGVARDRHRIPISGLIENSSLAKTAKSKARPIQMNTKKNAQRKGWIAIIVIALLQFVPTLIAFVVDDLLPEIESSFGNALHRITIRITAMIMILTMIPDYVYDTLYDVFGDNGITVSAFDNVYTFQASGDVSSHEPRTENGNRTFRSTAQHGANMSNGRDYYPRTEYPYDEYIMYSVYLYPEHQETNGPQQDWCDSMMQSKVDSILLNVFQSRTTDEVVVEDMGLRRPVRQRQCFAV